MSSPVDASGNTLLARLQGDQAAARREQQKDRVMLLGMIVSEVKNREIELRRELTDDDVIDVIRKGIKKRRESVEMYAKAGRSDLQDKEQQEVVLLEVYLPAQVDPAELRAAVQSAIAGGAANIGAVMARVMPAFKGRVDGSVINAIAREELARA
ncbi:GatB/YqeY domain-containing protein [Gemmatimonas phototrophica]|uniref:GatB/YqeY domain-containing protein n=1 Tax=Gemmatimonas phototrophica TaxID=1379270 RepID=UPI0006A72451|nr:GatB/YqeY domain-containing protein [Gemmatimonas phototrophica]